MRLFGDVASRVDDPFFAHAMALAVRARGAAAPNPLVGCVVVSGGRIVGEGFHPRAGEPHAEVFALADAGPDARGADVYVTLEPCSHQGRTPPCTDALIAAGVSAVHIGMRDPSALAGGGAELLRAAGISVDFAPDPQPFAELNAGWLKRLATGLPFVTAKVGLSLDGRPSFSAGVAASITGASGARVTRMLRAASDAVLVGGATAIADDPALTVRDGSGVLAKHQPQRVVLAGSEPLPADLLLFTDTAAPTTVLAPADAAYDLSGVPTHVTVVRYPAQQGLLGALRALGDSGVNDVLIEPGPRLLTALWREGLIDALVTVSAGGMAGSGAPELYGGPADRAGSELLHRFSPSETGIVGDVVATVWNAAEDQPKLAEGT